MAERLAAEPPEDRPEREHVVAHARSRRIELHAVAPLHVRTDLGAETETEAPAGGLRQLPRHLRGHHRAPRERDGNASEDVELRGGEGCRGTAQVRRAPGLGDDQPREPGRRGVSGEGLHPREGHRSGHEVDAHPPRMLTSRQARSAAGCSPPAQVEGFAPSAGSDET